MSWRPSIVWCLWVHLSSRHAWVLSASPLEIETLHWSMFTSSVEETTWKWLMSANSLNLWDMGLVNVVKFSWADDMGLVKVCNLSWAGEIGFDSVCNFLWAVNMGLDCLQVYRTRWKRIGWCLHIHLSKRHTSLCVHKVTCDCFISPNLLELATYDKLVFKVQERLKVQTKKKVEQWVKWERKRKETKIDRTRYFRSKELRIQTMKKNTLINKKAD